MNTALTLPSVLTYQNKFACAGQKSMARVCRVLLAAMLRMLL